MREGNLQQQQRQPGEEVRSEDLQRMLDRIEDLAKRGRAMPHKRCCRSSRISCETSSRAWPIRCSKAAPMARMLKELGELMRRQQQLMDETFRLPQGRMGQQQGEGEQGQQGQEGRPGPGGRQSGGRGQGQSGRLAEQQGQLGKALEDMLRQLGEQGMGRLEVSGGLSARWRTRPAPWKAPSVIGRLAHRMMPCRRSARALRPWPAR